MAVAELGVLGADGDVREQRDDDAGAFELMDLTGIDIGYRAKLARYAETEDPADRPSRTVTELVERGELGRKTGLGFYRYADDGTQYPRENDGTPR